MPYVVAHPLCSCTPGDTCVNCRFCAPRNTQQGRKALCEKIVHYLVLQPVYQATLAATMQVFFTNKVIYDDERDICTMLFEAVLFEDTSAGTTPLTYFIQHAPLSMDEKRLYDAWRTHTRYGLFTVESVTPGSELCLADLAGEHRYRVYEQRGTTTIRQGSVIVARIVPFLQGWMITTESIVSFSGGGLPERLRHAYDVAMPQLLFVQQHLADHRRRMAGG